MSELGHNPGWINHRVAGYAFVATVLVLWLGWIGWFAIVIAFLFERRWSPYGSKGVES
jgi:hypothetical protein